MSGVITEYPCSWLNQTFWRLEIKLLCLHVGSWIKVEGPSLSGIGDQAGIFINLKRTNNIVKSQPKKVVYRTGKTEEELDFCGKLTSSPEKY